MRKYFGLIVFVVLGLLNARTAAAQAHGPAGTLDTSPHPLSDYWIPASNTPAQTSPQVAANAVIKIIQDTDLSDGTKIIGHITKGQNALDEFSQGNWSGVVVKINGTMIFGWIPSDSFVFLVQIAAESELFSGIDIVGHVKKDETLYFVSKRQGDWYLLGNVNDGTILFGWILGKNLKDPTPLNTYVN